MVLSVPITEEAEARLKVKADAAGVDVATFAARTLERIASRPSLDEVLAPVRESFRRSGMTEEQLVELLEEVKHQARAERRSRGTP